MPSLSQIRRSELFQRAMKAIRHAVRWSDDNLPRGVRAALGVVLVAGGVFSFLPVLGLWMLPAGLALVALDIPGWRGWVLRKTGAKKAESTES